MKNKGPRTLRQLVNHDMRTPLAVILGQCEMLEAGLHGDLGDRQLRAIQTIARNAARLQSELDEAAQRVVDGE